MRFGYCVNMLSLPGSDRSGREFLPMIAGLSFDYVELPLAQMMVYDDGNFIRLFLRQTEELGIPCRCCNNFFPASIRLTGPAADHNAALGYADKALARAKRLGAEKIVFGSSGARNYPIGFSKEAALAQIMDFLTRLEPLCAEYGICIVLEHLNRMESNLINTLNEASALRQAINLPHIENLLDHYHLLLSGCGVEEIRQVGSHLKHVHIARILGRSLPQPGDDSCVQETFAALRDIGYDGDISIEAYAPFNNRTEAIAASLSYLKKLTN